GSDRQSEGRSDGPYEVRSFSGWQDIDAYGARSGSGKSADGGLRKDVELPPTPMSPKQRDMGVLIYPFAVSTRIKCRPLRLVSSGTKPSFGNPTSPVNSCGPLSSHCRHSIVL